MQKSPVVTYKDLIVWQKSMSLVKEIYRITQKFPRSETYGISLQMRRAAVSIPSNIAEGRRFSGKKEFARFLRIALGSGTELETQIEISKMLSLCNPAEFEKAESLLLEVMKMLNRMILNLKQALQVLTPDLLTPNS